MQQRVLVAYGLRRWLMKKDKETVIRIYPAYAELLKFSQIF